MLYQLSIISVYCVRHSLTVVFRNQLQYDTIQEFNVVWKAECVRIATLRYQTSMDDTVQL